MMTDVTFQLAEAGVTEAQVAAAVALFADAPVDQLFGYAIVAIIRHPDNPYGIKVISSMSSNRRLCAEVLEHAASHMHGWCRKCDKAERRARRAGR